MMSSAPPPDVIIYDGFIPNGQRIEPKVRIESVHCVR